MGRPRVVNGPTSKGYGQAHIDLRRALLARWRPGQPCARCGQPMTQRWTTDRTGRIITAIQLDHTDDRAGYLGLSHARCNLGHRKPRPDPPPAPGRRW